MKPKIAVESQLSNISAYLGKNGYEVQEFQHNEGAASQVQNAAAIVVSGLDQNMLGYEDIKTRAPLINASGLSPQEVGAMIAQKLIQL